MVYNAYHLVKLARLTLLVILLASCTELPNATPKKISPLDFDTAIHRMAEHLLTQVKIDKEQPEQNKPILIIIEHFVDATQGKMVTISQQIEQKIADESQKHFNDFTLVQLTPPNLSHAHYRISGVIDREENKMNDYYRVSATVVNLKTGKVIANSEEFISSSGLLNQPTSPPVAEIPEEIANKPIESEMSFEEELEPKEHYTSLTTADLLTEADTAYEEKNYKKSIGLFNLAVQRPDGKVMKTYAGLYQGYLQLKNTALAAKAFNQLLAVSVEENKKLNTKFLFLPNSTDFIDDKELRAEYDFWLQQIANYFKNNDQCFQIEGHSTRAESKQDSQLALLRAQKIQNLMAIDFPQIKQKSIAVGKPLSKRKKANSSEIIDTINRRVEIVVVACSPI
ncbi:outer membrane protein/peptidoglycan-associated (lipo)protein [Thioploca ingrica]|uniref:Outer membrane protein/peptidoglycan-associated (Lipo)protein n=1 Tax=Thioploca ingrica TaxID=40754 RepID=A0A090AN28_9GAMM|nr:outer membrane protein/peptidoglycan-associated (lipo)protein [Thioploca ingrica]